VIHNDIEVAVDQLKRSLMPTQAEWDRAWNVMTHHAASIDFVAERGCDRAREFLGDDEFAHLVESMAVFCLTSLALGKGKRPRKTEPASPATGG
jgi:hypothetical protein